MRTRRRPTYAVAGLVVLAVVWWSFVRGVRVPLLGMVDLAAHEAGHLFFLWAPRDVMLAMGNGFQVLVPLVFAGAFVVRHRDLAGGAAALAWAASSFQDASVYIADAPVRRLPLLGPEDSHDWWQLLGAHGWLGAADELAKAVWFVGLVVLVAAGWLLVVGLRWDDAWIAGAPGTLYAPWGRRPATLPRVTGLLADPAAQAPGHGGTTSPQHGATPAAPGAEAEVPPGWDDVPWGTGRSGPPA